MPRQHSYGPGTILKSRPSVSWSTLPGTGGKRCLEQTFSVLAAQGLEIFSEQGIFDLEK